MTNSRHPDSLEALLPWYATGRLSAEDRDEVAAALEVREDLALQLRLVEEDREATILLNRDLGSPGGAVWDRIAVAVAAQPRRRSVVARLTGWFARGSGAPRDRLALAGGAAAVVIALQTAAILTLLPSPGGFHAASARAGVATGAQALMAFSAEARLDQVGALLAETHGTIVEGPRGGFYKIRFGAAPVSKPAFDALLARLRANAIVKSALPAGSGS